MITYTDSIEGITPEHLKGFFNGWKKPVTPEAHLRILSRSYAFVLAIDSINGNVVGFVNAISDGVLSAYIPLIEVLPKYRGKGIGTKLMKFMIDRFRNLYMIDVTCDEDLVPFYNRLGMMKSKGMMIRNYK